MVDGSWTGRRKMQRSHLLAVPLPVRERNYCGWKPSKKRTYEKLRLLPGKSASEDGQRLDRKTIWSFDRFRTRGR